MLHDITTWVQCRARIIIYTDNLNTVQMFNSLACLPDYNLLLHHSVDIILAHSINLHVLYVAGEQNVVTDALSQCQFSTWHCFECSQQSPDLNFSTPSMDIGGATKMIPDPVIQPRQHKHKC